MFYPKLVHKHTLEQIGCYLKAASDNGLIMKLSEKLFKIDSFLMLILLGCSFLEQNKSCTVVEVMKRNTHDYRKCQVVVR